MNARINKFKRIILAGKVVPGKGAATYRLNQLVDAFAKKIPCFQEFSKVGGTLNIEIEQSYPKKTIQGEGIIRFEPKETDGEGFTFIPILKIQNEEVDAYICSPDRTCNPDNVVEVIAKFRIRDKYNLQNGDRILIETIM